MRTPDRRARQRTAPRRPPCGSADSGRARPGVLRPGRRPQRPSTVLCGPKEPAHIRAHERAELATAKRGDSRRQTWRLAGGAGPPAARIARKVISQRGICTAACPASYRRPPCDFPGVMIVCLFQGVNGSPLTILRIVCSGCSVSSGWGRGGRRWCGRRRVPGQAARAGGARWVASKTPSKASCQGQCWGRCRISWSRPRCASRAGTLISSRRTVAPRAFAWRREARVAVARRRLCSIPAQVNQAAFAAKSPDGQVRERAVDEVGDHLLDDGVVAVVGLGGEHRQRAVGEDRVVAPRGEQLALGGWGEAADPAHDQPGGHPMLVVAGERGVADLGDFGVGDPALLVLVEDRVRVADGGPGVLGDRRDRLGDLAVHPGGDREPHAVAATRGDRGAA